MFGNPSLIQFLKLSPITYYLAKMLSYKNITNTKAKTLLATAASVAASAMLIRSIANDFLPREIQGYFFSCIRKLSHHFSSQLTIVIEEFQGFSIKQVYEATDIYLGTINTPSIKRFRVGKSEKEKKLVVTLSRNEEMVDVFENVLMKWRLITTQVESSSSTRIQNIGDHNASPRSEIRSHELCFHKKHKEKVLSSYLPYILEKARAIREDGKIVKLHFMENGTNRFRSGGMNAINLNHPMTFETLAMDSKLKKALIEDLNNFLNRKECYKRIGKAWKRGYLLYGPPGTGKSSLIAAMANHLNFDIYDLDLNDIRSNSHLKSLLPSMSARSILVIEDIDCSIKLENQDSNSQPWNHGNSKMTLSGLLNFIDGLWSCCGDERIIIFTTNHKERLDPALLRPGRMDMHICLSYCTISAFKQPAFNYLEVGHHILFERIERLVEKVEVTPAEVAEELMKINDPEASLQGLLNFLQDKMTEQDKDNCNRN